jgi:hypothetical protein
VPQIQPVAWNKLGLNEESLEQIIQKVEDKLIEAKQFSLEIQSSDESKAPNLPAVP